MAHNETGATEFHTMSDVRAAFPLFFERGTMRFFDSRIESTLYAGRYFISSEQFHDGTYHAPRKYSIQEVTPTGINTVGEFNEIHTLEDARAMTRELVKQNKQEQAETEEEEE